ncbi:MAG: hypothetical protein NTW17_03415 [Candidatus Pacearchaeota archaeon]|nr:hypothetical protein [Candidatus Pacearchaeota archaeon]
MKNRRGISGIVETVIMIALAVALVSIVWFVVNNLVTGRLGEAEACFGVFEKVTINSKYTCYNYSGDELQFSITRDDIDNVDDILVSIANESSTTSFKIEEDSPNELSYLDRTFPAHIPGKNSGRTYIYSGISEVPDSLEIALIINGKMCEGPNPISQFDNCALLVD